MSFKSKILAAAATLTLVSGAGLAGVLTSGTAQASSFSCTSRTACGGDVLAYTAKGTLALSVLTPDANTNGGSGYWNEPVGFGAEDYPSGTGAQDFTVFQVAGEPGPGQGGEFGHGEYVVMYTPGGQLPADPVITGKTGTQTAYCLSVQDLYRTVRGHRAQRWATVLRPCDTFAGGVLQSAAPVFTQATATATPQVTDADPYQLWAPVEVSGPYLEYQNTGLDNSSSYRHGYGGVNFVLDDTAFGGAGTQGLAFPENDGANQKGTIIGCSDPITSFNPVYYDCPAGPAPASTPAT